MRCNIGCSFTMDDPVGRFFTMDGRAYNWISSLPPLSQWDVFDRTFVFLEGSVHINVRREDITGVTVYLNFSKDREVPEYCGRVGHFTEEQPKVISSLLFKNFHAFISLMLSRFEKNGFDDHNDLPSLEELILSDVDSAVTRNPSYPLVFDSLLLYICLLSQTTVFAQQPEEYTYNKIYTQLTSTDVLLAIGHRLETLYLHFLQLCLEPSDSYIDAASKLIWKFRSETSHSYVVSTSKFWKIGIQGRALRAIRDERYYVRAGVPEPMSSQWSSQQLNCTIQLEHHVNIKNKLIEAQVHVDNLICDVLPFKILPKYRKEKFIWTERFFPSKIVISVVPQCPSNDLILSLGQSTDNPAVQTSTGQSLELSFQTPKEAGIKQSSATSSTQTVSYWKFLQTAEGANGSFKWILYDPLSGVEVISSKPPKKSIFKSDPKAWYKDRYRKACSPFSDEGGVVFGADKYGRTLTWTMNRNMEGKMLKFKVEGSIWLTYWPNLYKTSSYATVRHDFSEEVELELTET